MPPLKNSSYHHNRQENKEIPSWTAKAARVCMFEQRSDDDERKMVRLLCCSLLHVM